MINVVIKLKAPFDADPQAALAQLAQLSLDIYGEGGNPEAAQIEDFIGGCNTPVFGGYCRFLATEAYGVALEYIEANGGNPLAELVRVEWPTVADPVTGEITPAVYEPITYSVDVFDMDGNKTGTRMQEIGRIAGAMI